jgi:Glycosyltransferase like family 2
MISYCVAVFRPVYARRLIDDLIRKTSAPYEILLWVNVADTAFEEFLRARTADGAPIRVLGVSHENIGMRSFRTLFAAARFPLIAQVDDDVICVSPRIAERAAEVFARWRDVRMIVADVWQDDLSTGARPPLSAYRCVDANEGLYDGPIDGWFGIYQRSILPLLLSLPYRPYFYLGAAVRQRLAQQRMRGLLCTRMKVFHVIGPEYASLFGMLDLEIDKYRRLGRVDIVRWYEEARRALPPRPQLQDRVDAIVRALENEPSR